MHLLVIENKTSNTIYTMQELHTFYKHSMELYLKFHFHKYFYYTHQPIYQLFFFYTYNFYNKNNLQNYMIYHIHTHNY